MKLAHVGVPVGNFGDDLNLWLWPRLMPGVLDSNGRVLFFGIGTVLHNKVALGTRKVVFGSGTGYKRPPRLDDSWRIYCVRGPLTARALGLDARLAITDAAYLLRTVTLPEQEQNSPVAFMPHCGSGRFVNWQALCARIGMRYIDPAAPIEVVLKHIRQSRLLLAEALHGAIAADAFRIPWVAVRYSHKILAFKWHDWCHSLSLQYQPVDLPRILEAQLPYAERVKRCLKYSAGKSPLGKAKWTRLPFMTSSPKALDQASAFLAALPQRAEPCLSRDVEVDRAISRLQDTLAHFVRDHQAGLWS